jgi:hypothetical protein
MCREPMGSSASSPCSFPGYEWSSGRESSLYSLGGMVIVNLRLGVEVELRKPYLGAYAVQAPICRLCYPLFQVETLKCTWWSARPSAPSLPSKHALSRL